MVNTCAGTSRNRVGNNYIETSPAAQLDMSYSATTIKKEAKKYVHVLMLKLFRFVWSCSNPSPTEWRQVMTISMKILTIKK